MAEMNADAAEVAAAEVMDGTSAGSSGSGRQHSVPLMHIKR